jgi:hypothetical protein
LKSYNASKIVLTLIFPTSDVIAAIAFGEDWGGDVTTEHPARKCTFKQANCLLVDYLAHPFLLSVAGINEISRLTCGMFSNPVRGTFLAFASTARFGNMKSALTTK